MPAAVPSLEGQVFVTDPQSIIALTLRRYFRQPADTIPILGELIISLPYQVARFGKEPDNLANNMQNELQTVLSRIFGTERVIKVSVIKDPVDSITFNMNIAITYSTIAGDVGQVGTGISLKNGRLVIPEDTLNYLTTLTTPQG